jgi:peptide-methionine (S)-S-oxide reductase
MGCFWEPSETLLKQPGILASAVGYTGAPLSVTSRQPPPTYDTVCFGNDYVEAVRVVYDDSVVTYETVLDYFYKCQKPGYTRQYASVIFVNDEKEGKIAKQWKLDRQSSSKESAQKQGGNDNSNFIYDNLSIEPAASFYRAEEYHQRYWEKQRLRALFGLALIAGESGAYNTYLENIIGKQMMEDLLFGQSFDTLCGGVFLAGAGWMLVERLIARDVRELKPGDLIQQL